MELFDVLIFGAIFFYIVRAVRRAASAGKDRRPPGSIASEDGEQLSWAERTQRALEGAMEWEEEQDRVEDEADLRAEIEAMRAAERGAASPWRQPREEQRRSLEAAEREVRHARLPVSTIATGLDSSPTGSAASSLSGTLQTVANMLEQRTSGRRESTSVARRSPAQLTTTGIDVEATRVPNTTPAVKRRTTGTTLTDLPGLERLTPLQRAIVYGEIFGRPVALGGGIDGSPD